MTWKERRLEYLRQAVDQREPLLNRLLCGAIVFYGDRAEAEHGPASPTPRAALGPVGGVDYIPPRKKGRK